MPSPTLRATFLLAVCLWTIPGRLSAADASSVTQYGITWTFDKAYPAGQFVNGDWWVVGPVTVVSVSPAPGPAPDTEPSTEQKSYYGTPVLGNNKDLRNGSMIVEGPAKVRPNSCGFEEHGYDSRAVNYAASLTAAYPLKLAANRSLISTVSSETYGPDGKLQTPSVIGNLHGVFTTAKTIPVALQSAAILTCLSAAPPEDAFRPPYVGTDKPIYRAKDIRWDMLPKLKPAGRVPDWAMMERVFERPWIDHIYSWANYDVLPGENGPAYGREFSRFGSLASLMLLLDEPPEKKRKLMIEFVQLGIDLAGITKTGRQYFSDGGHWQGRKWPILFASLVLDRPELRAFPAVPLGQPLYGTVALTASEGAAPATTLFQEDLDTYYGAGALGQSALWQCVFHTGPRDPYQEKREADFTADDKFVDNYRSNNSAAWVGTALAVQMMRAKALWNHDAFFDYVDHWMGPVETWVPPTWMPKGQTRAYDAFAEEMWKAHRPDVPAQPGGAENLKWVWNADKKAGRLVLNPKPLSDPKND